ncbi:hypothetical protein SteCoe_25886 [Stentor coeruleus]|uniref:DDE-1 domain-containing protein n=1 Tax=Stentor coeruleus TaxID=5963 RepID=A0A1R2BE93_9CILI|nr:hypothetical protein SteCoe_25886 [Stentor coeruleus]
MTSEAQPLDQGVIRAFKLYYRTRLLESYINHIEELNSCEEYAKQVTILDAIRWIIHAWDKVKIDTIEKCFTKTGFSFAISTELVVDHPDASDSITLERILSYTFNNAASVEEYIGYDNNVEISDSHGENIDEILQNVVEEAMIAQIKNQEYLKQKLKMMKCLWK